MHIQLLQEHPFHTMPFLPSLLPTWSWRPHLEECLLYVLQSGHRHVCVCVCVCAYTLVVCTSVSSVSMFVFVVWLDSISLWVMLVPVINPITDSAADRECECQWDCQWRLVGSGGYHCWLPLRGLLGSLSHWKYVNQWALFWRRASKPIPITVAVLQLIHCRHLM